MTRACDGCTMCCKLLEVVELKKPMGERCVHALAGRQGCAIYAERPFTCRAFNCAWLTNADMPDHWRPDRSKMVVALDETGTVVSIIAEATHLDVWKKQPFYGDIKGWARQPSWRVQVLAGKHGWVIFPEEDLYVGERKPDDQIAAFGYREVGLARQPAVIVRHGDGSTTEHLGGLHAAGGPLTQWG